MFVFQYMIFIEQIPLFCSWKAKLCAQLTLPSQETDSGEEKENILTEKFLLQAAFFNNCSRIIISSTKRYSQSSWAYIHLQLGLSNLIIIGGILKMYFIFHFAMMLYTSKLGSVVLCENPLLVISMLYIWQLLFDVSRGCEHMWIFISFLLIFYLLSIHIFLLFYALCYCKTNANFFTRGKVIFWLRLHTCRKTTFKSCLCVLGKVIKFSVSQFYYLQNGDKCSSQYTVCFED